MIIRLRVSRLTHGHRAEVHSYQFDEDGDVFFRVETERGFLDLSAEDFNAMCKAIDCFKAAEIKSYD